MSRKVRGKPPARDHHEVGEGPQKIFTTAKDYEPLTVLEYVAEIGLGAGKKPVLSMTKQELQLALIHQIKRRREAEAGLLEYRRLIFLIPYRQRVALWKRLAIEDQP